MVQTALEDVSAPYRAAEAIISIFAAYRLDASLLRSSFRLFGSSSHTYGRCWLGCSGVRL
jgi:hypothetical protein